MKFSTVKIRRSGKCNLWEVHFEDLPGDRSNWNYGPHNSGVFHYPRRMGKEKAFEELKAHMVARLEEEIAALTKSLVKMKALKMPDENFTRG